MRAAVVGAGPAGFYTAQALLKRFPSCTVDILERLPVPFGLVRYGVAPDHPATKNVINQFTNLVDTNRHRLNFYGNVSVGHQPHNTLTPQELTEHYNLTIYATGAAHPRNLSIQIPPHRVHSAHDFVFWLNGHPDAYLPSKDGTVAERIQRDLESATDIAVVGLGNVAIDVARLLLRPVDDLRATDISPAALDLLTQSLISSVTVFGRKNPARAAWTTAALREIVTKIPGIVTACDHALIKRDLQEPNLPRPKKSSLKLLAEKTVDSGSPDFRTCTNGKLLQLKFLQSPTRFSLNERTVKMHFSDTDTESETNREYANNQYPLPNASSEHDSVFLSLGYIGDSGEGWRVGWANENASGIIGDNKWDAETVVNQISLPHELEFISNLSGPPEWFSSKATEVVTWEGWQLIDKEERRRAAYSDVRLSRIKIHSLSDMLNVANGSKLSAAHLSIPGV